MKKSRALLLFVVGFFAVAAAISLNAAGDLEPRGYLPAVVFEPTFTPEPTPTLAPTPTSTPMPTSEPEPPPTGCNTCSFDAYNCSDFSRQRDAQACHDYCMEQVGFDVHRLDRDGDGRACESLP